MSNPSRTVTVSGVTIDFTGKVIATHGPNAVTLPPDPKPVYHDEPPFDRENIDARVEHAYWIFDALKSGRGRGEHLAGSPMDERAAFKAAVRRLLNADDCKPT